MITPFSSLTTLLRYSLATLLWAALPAHAEMSVTPRFGYYFDNTSQRQSAVDYSNILTPEDLAADEAFQQAFVQQLGGSYQVGAYEHARNSSQLAFPQYGGTFTFTPASLDATQFAFTALYGKTSGNGTELIQRFRAYSVLGLLLRDTEVTSIRTSANYSRLDVEGTVQHRLNETFSLIGGARAERVTIEGSDQTASVQSYHLYNAVIDQLGLPLAPRYQTAEPRNVETYSANSWTYSVRGGAAAFAPVGEKHLFYVNGLLQLSHHPANNVYFTNAGGSGLAPANSGQGSGTANQSETTLGPDISVGYMYRVNDRFGIDVRYRATVYFTVKGESDFKDSRVNHGLGVGFTTWLGSR